MTARTSHEHTAIAYLLDRAAEAIRDAEDWMDEARELGAITDVAVALDALGDGGDSEWGTLAARIERMSHHHADRAKRAAA